MLLRSTPAPLVAREGVKPGDGGDASQPWLAAIEASAHRCIGTHPERRLERPTRQPANRQTANR